MQLFKNPILIRQPKTGSLIFTENNKNSSFVYLYLVSTGSQRTAGTFLKFLTIRVGLHHVYPSGIKAFRTANSCVFLFAHTDKDSSQGAFTQTSTLRRFNPALTFEGTEKPNGKKLLLSVSHFPFHATLLCQETPRTFPFVSFLRQTELAIADISRGLRLTALHHQIHETVTSASYFGQFSLQTSTELHWMCVHFALIVRYC